MKVSDLEITKYRMSFTDTTLSIKHFDEEKWQIVQLERFTHIDPFFWIEMFVLKDPR